jgi:hypothetical protein
LRGGIPRFFKTIVGARGPEFEVRAGEAMHMFQNKNIFTENDFKKLNKNIRFAWNFLGRTQNLQDVVSQ